MPLWSVYGNGRTVAPGDVVKPEQRLSWPATIAMGGQHVECTVEDIVEDSERKLVSTPAYMLAESIAQAAAGINKLVDRVLELAQPH